jgi:hypothetical protein
MVSPTVDTSEHLTAVMTHVGYRHGNGFVRLPTVEKQQNQKRDSPEILQTANRLVSNRRGSAEEGLWCVVLGDPKALGSNETSVTTYP